MNSTRASNRNGSRCPSCFIWITPRSMADIREAIAAGFTSVMIDASEKRLEDNIADSKEAADYAHRQGVSVEAELGMIGTTDFVETDKDEELFTDPQEALRFVRRDGRGRAGRLVRHRPRRLHGEASRSIDYKRLQAIRTLTPVHLVLHGGSGVPAEMMKQAIQLPGGGVSKVNIATDLELAFLAALGREERMTNVECLSPSPERLANGREAVEDRHREDERFRVQRRQSGPFRAVIPISPRSIPTTFTEDAEFIDEERDKKKLYMIGNAHLDPVWLWQLAGGLSGGEGDVSFGARPDEGIRRFRLHVQLGRDVRVGREERSRHVRGDSARVPEGRWKIVGGWWIQPDCNIPSGESFVRQGLYGQRYFKEKLGVTAKVGYNVDSFGHNGMMPQILKKSGMDYYVMMRPMPNEKGASGPAVLVGVRRRLPGAGVPHPVRISVLGQRLGEPRPTLRRELTDAVDQLMCFYGVGNHGGGPTKENIDSIRRMNGRSRHAEARYSARRTDISTDIGQAGLPFPVVHDDLQHHASGCYAAHSGIKQWNRQAENRLIAAEKFSALAAWVTGQPYPLRTSSRAWKNVLFNQFHDISGRHEPRSRRTTMRATDTAKRWRLLPARSNYAVQSLSWNIASSRTRT